MPHMRELLNKKEKLIWSECHQKKFKALKAEVNKDSFKLLMVLSHFGMGLCFTQLNPKDPIE